MKIGTYLVDTRGHAHKNSALNRLCHIYLFDPFLLHVTEEEGTSFDIDTQGMGISSKWHE